MNPLEAVGELGRWSQANQWWVLGGWGLLPLLGGRRRWHGDARASRKRMGVRSLRHSVRQRRQDCGTTVA